MEATENTKPVYISGKITGLTEEEFTKNFEAAEMHLKSQGHQTMNPVTLCAEIPKDSSWEEYMALCVRGLMNCKEIYMLRNWSDSKGARVERAIAFELGLPVNYQS